MTVAARPRFPVVLTVLAVLLLGALLALGVWQVQRMQWKEGLITGAEAAADKPPLPLAEVLKVENPEFRRVILTCRGLSAAPYVELQSIENSDAGVRLVSACAVEGGPTLLVDRGFVAADISARPSVKADDTMPVVITGVLRRSPAPSALTPPPAGNHFYGRDAEAMARALKVEGPISPFTVFATTSTNPDWQALKPSAPPAAFTNNHLGYALTWFGLAAALIAFYVVLLRRRMTRKDSVS
ncbi:MULTISPECIES: SURF1 family protein [unclassified Brevundimonas]|uniref:SURF1 family protein n=1 Tax=unclassified Brevundimonas TaxID=2622653 RepID=UPI000CFC24B4|nr:MULTISPECIES: SURF1 family protein [unclassified Brevundimonas]PRA31715.1 Surfeit locus 1 family protein [Brevundimonas sp. MYb27]PQZ83588.1 Surfeit locus 1 family protein [Brevundimonas sp. MYb31]PRB15823.1 Surfeit locus 1 family protein [Brevundimonas sp. MYb52]PRB36319.1 Surfeit locus 1 family protein [Brevundimonas sp. MYb46]PRB46953.1 Surfeit locus 1 family protein [Brevundimonas sp. MYb33]